MGVNLRLSSQWAVVVDGGGVDGNGFLSAGVRAVPEIWDSGNLPIPPSLGKVLQNGLGLVLFGRFWHHVQDIVHGRRTKLQVVVRLDTLLSDRLGNIFAVTTFELAGEEISEPPLKKRDGSAHEE